MNCYWKTRAMVDNNLSPRKSSVSHGYNKKFEVNGYAVEISSAVSFETIRDNWKLIERDNSVPFFMTWGWISTWINTYSPDLITVSARYKNEIVALGLFTESTEIRHRIIHSRQLRLHQMGNESMDQIWIEYNDFIGQKEHLIDAVNACLKALQHKEFNWNEIVFSMIRESRVNNIVASFPTSKIGDPVENYATNLVRIREKRQTYLQTLSANTRSQINRSIKRYEESFGSLELSVAKNKAEALTYFNQAGLLHMQKWGDSGYKNSQFIRFHENLIKDNFDEGSIHLSRLMTGSELIAILYSHISKKQVFFYLQGLNYHQDKKLKPGLVAHALASELFLQQGMDCYNYMGGYSQYKKQLASRTENLTSIIIQRAGSQFWLENMARKIKRRIIRPVNK